MKGSSRISVLYKGRLESAGLAEVAYFLKKAKQQLDHARFAITNTDFEASAELFDESIKKISEITNLIVETRRGIEAAELRLAERAEADEETKTNNEETTS